MPENLLLRQMDYFIPAEFLRYKFQFIAEVLSCATKVNYTALQVEQFLGTKDDISNLSREAIGNPPSGLLWEASMKYSSPRTLYLAPPCDSCLVCASPLIAHNHPTTVICYTEQGPVPAIKIILRCSREGCGINYRYNQYGSELMGGYRYYSHGVRPYVKASQTCFVERTLYEKWCAYSHHAWVSFEATAEVYNEVGMGLPNVRLTEAYLQNNPLRGAETSSLYFLHRKTVAEAFWNAELESELRQRGWLERCFNDASSREQLMEEIDHLRASTIYPHDICSAECKQRGCGRLFSIDGNWKISYPHCMWRVPMQVKGFKGCLSYVDCCVD